MCADTIRGAQYDDDCRVSVEKACRRGHYRAIWPRALSDQAREDVHVTFLPYSPRRMLESACRLLLTGGGLQTAVRQCCCAPSAMAAVGPGVGRWMVDTASHLQGAAPDTRKLPDVWPCRAASDGTVDASRPCLRAGPAAAGARQVRTACAGGAPLAGSGRVMGGRAACLLLLRQKRVAARMGE